jgi:hypothetical protein
MVALSIPRCPCLVAFLVLATAPFRPAAGEAEDLPLRRVVLFTAGVGFFERGGEVVDTASVELTFDTSEINDLLKSMVVQDLGGGIVSRVTCGSPDPLSGTLDAFAVNLADNPTLADLLSQLRGTRVRLKTPEAVEGTVVGVEVRTALAGETLRETEWVVLLTDEGLQGFDLAKLVAVKVLDPQIDQQMQQALAEVAKSRQEDKRRVNIEFRGEGRRPVTIGYIREFPVWKTSYRLVLSDDKPPFLQGWAIVENTTDEDWDNVRLTLISGRPVSFVMELDEPLYVDRPHVMPELYGSVAPRVHDRGRQAAAERAAEAGAGMGGMGGMGGSFGGRHGGMGGFGGMGGYFGGDDKGLGNDAPDLQKGVVPDVATEEVGELFRYEIQLPVALARNQSAMFPIVNQGVTGEKLSIYNMHTHVKHPMHGLKLTNTTELHLMQGPITVFEDGAYAGDARIRDLAPGATRLVSYALDLDVQVAARVKETEPTVSRVRIDHGIVTSARSVVRSTCYSVDCEAAREAKLIIEHPIDKAFQLQSKQQLEETTEDVYRFGITTLPGKTVECTVSEEQTTEEHNPLATLDEATIQLYLANDRVADTVKDAFRRLLSRRRDQAANAAAIASKREAISDIETMQSRIRENMRALDKTSELYQKYVRTLTEQETQLAELTRELQGLQQTKQRLESDSDPFQ